MFTLLNKFGVEKTATTKLAYYKHIMALESRVTLNYLERLPGIITKRNIFCTLNVKTCHYGSRKGN